MNAEIISYVRRVIRGFDIDAEHIGMDVIRQVGPQGAFISTEQTMKYFKEEHWQAQLCNRETLEPWIAQGEKTWGQKAVDKAIDIIKNHRAQKMPTDVQQSLDEIREKALETLSGEYIEA